MRYGAGDERREPGASGNPVTLRANALLTAHEVAEILKVPVSWVYEHTRPGCGAPLPHTKLGKYLRFFAADILNYLEAIRSRDLPRQR